MRFAPHMTILFLATAMALTARMTSAAPAAGQGLAVLLVEQEQKGCAFRVQFPALGRTDDWFALPGCLADAGDLIFDPAQHRAIFRRAGKYWTVDLAKGAKPVLLADAFTLQPDPDNIEIRTWIDKASGRLRVARLIEETDETKKLLALAPADAAANGERLREGSPALAVAAELGADGKWKVLAVRPTTTEVEGSLGLGAVSTFMAPKAGMVSLHDLLFRATCAEQVCSSRPTKLSKATERWARQVYKANIDQDGPAFSYVALGEKDGLLSGVAFGDSFHWVSPLFYCAGPASARCSSHAKISGRDQMGISVRAGYALITQEYEGTHARLFKSGSGKSVVTYKPDTIAAWLPLLPW